MALSDKYDSSRFMNDDFPFAVLRVTHDDMHTPKPHSHEFIELVYVESGSGQHLFEGESYAISAGNVFIINPGESHTFHMARGESLTIINCLFEPHLIHESILRELVGYECMDYFYIHPFLDPSERFNHIVRLNEQDARRVLTVLQGMQEELVSRQVGYEAVIRIRMIELLVLLSRFYLSSQHPGIEGSSFTKKVLALRIGGYLERHYQQKITLDSLASIFNISTRQLGRIVRQELGASVVERVHQIRIDKAKYLLLHSDTKIITIAGMVGYDDPAFFSHLFTRHTGCSPGRYRLLARSERIGANDQSGRRRR